MKETSPANGDRLLVRWRIVDLPRREGREHQKEETFRTRIAAARIGDAIFVFLPGEPFIELASTIRKASPFPFTAVMGYSEDYIGYIPTDQAFENGGYETRPGRWSRLAPGSETTLCDQAIRLLRTL